VTWLDLISALTVVASGLWLSFYAGMTNLTPPENVA
jgi:hypothetical protein